MKICLFLSVLLVFSTTNALAPDAGVAGKSCGEIAVKCERGCEDSSNRESYIATGKRDYEERTPGLNSLKRYSQLLLSRSYLSGRRE